MTTSPVSRALRHLCGAALRRDGAGLSDGQLLEHFVGRRDAAAFEALVRRHGPMVLGVCRRLLRDPHDADDAFQATFLVLVRKAGSVAPRELVGNWLYGVAYRTALEARAAAARRRTREKQVPAMPEPCAEPDQGCHELRALLDRELSRLPEKYRVPVVLCELEGRPRKEVARQLRVPEGTLSSRLAAARKLLARRLRGRGAAWTGGALSAALAENAARAGLPAVLVSSVIRAATGPAVAAGTVPAHVLTLTENVVKAMFLSKLKVLTALTLAVGLVGGAGVFSHRALAERPADTAQQKKDEPKKDGEKKDGDKKGDEKGEAKKPFVWVRGTLKVADAAKQKITVAVRESNKDAQENDPTVDKTFDLAKEVKVTIDGKPAKLADLQMGSKLSLKMSADKKAVVAIAVGGDQGEKKGGEKKDKEGDG